jgi:hypothetical protein
MSTSDRSTYCHIKIPQLLVHYVWSMIMTKVEETINMHFHRVVYRGHIAVFMLTKSLRSLLNLSLMATLFSIETVAGPDNFSWDITVLTQFWVNLEKLISLKATRINNVRRITIATAKFITILHLHKTCKTCNGMAFSSTVEDSLKTSSAHCSPPICVLLVTLPVIIACSYNVL